MNDYIGPKIYPQEPENPERMLYGPSDFQKVASANQKVAKDIKPLLADGPKMICEFNPKGAAYFADRVCEVCDQPIMTHWIVPSDDAEKRATYWCNPEGTQESTGMKV